jgi:O-antigen ligase
VAQKDDLFHRDLSWFGVNKARLLSPTMPSDRIASQDPLRTGWLWLALGATALMTTLPFLLPIHRHPIQSFYQEWLAFALGCAAFFAFGFAVQRHRLEAPRVILFPLGLCLLLGIQVAAGKPAYWQQATLGALYLLWAAAIATLGAGLRRHLGWAGFTVLLSWVLLAGVLATVLLAAAQLAGWRGGGWIIPLMGGRVFGNLGQANHFADYVSLGLVAVVYLAVSARLPKLPAATIAALFLAVLNFSGSRAVWIYLVAAAALAWWLQRKAPGQQARAVLAWTCALVGAMALLQLITYVVAGGAGSTGETVATRMVQEGTGLPTRLRHGQAAWMMLQSAPLLGVGFEAYGWQHFLLSLQLPPQLDTRVGDHSHNIVLQITAEFGLLGLGLVLATAWLWLVAQRSATFGLERWWVLALLATLLGHSLLEYPLWYAYFLGVFALLLGASDEATWRFSSPALDRVAFLGALALAAWTLTSAMLDYRALEDLARAPPGSAARIELARDRALTLHRGSLFTPLVEFELARTIRIDPEALEDKLAVSAHAVRYLPSAEAVFRHSALLTLAGELAESFRFWELGAAAYPSQAVVAARRLQELAEGEPGLRPLVEYAASR